MLKKVLVFFTASVILVGLMSFIPTTEETARAQSSGSLTGGHAWSSNIGWIQMVGRAINNGQYGVEYNSSTREFSGYAWSSNIGWINFKPTSGYPTGGPAHGVKLSADGTRLIGWAQACSVFQNGCSGTLKPNGARGDWDGWIKMSGTARDGTPYGVMRNGTTFKRCIQDKSCAWGSEVVGWVDFSRITCAECGPGGSTDRQLTVSKSGDGTGTVQTVAPSTGINCGSDCSHDYTNGTVVRLSAAPTEGDTFIGWSSNCTAVSGQPTTVCQVTMDQAKTVTAEFDGDGDDDECDVPIPPPECRHGGSDPDLEVVINGQGSVSGSGINCVKGAGGYSGSCVIEDIESPTTYNLTAAPATGYSFGNWDDCDSTTGQACSVRVENSSRTVTVTFSTGGNCEATGTCPPNSNLFGLSCPTTYTPPGASAQCQLTFNCDLINNCISSGSFSQAQWRVGIINNHPDFVSGYSYDLDTSDVPTGLSPRFCSSENNTSTCVDSIDELPASAINFFIRFYKDPGANPPDSRYPMELTATWSDDTNPPKEKVMPIWLRFINQAGGQ